MIIVSPTAPIRRGPSDRLHHLDVVLADVLSGSKDAEKSVIKRAFDILAAVAGLVLTSPILLVLVVLIQRDSIGPAIFRQQRVGKHERVFECYKLRTMTVDTPDLPTHMASSAQVTKIGKVLRRTKLDELPQLWNIIKGEMSFVGPRPCLPKQTELIEERRKRGVYRILPGITGLAQIQDIDMSDPVRLAEKDAEYLKSQSFTSDLSTIFRTIFARAGAGDRIRN